MYAISMHEEGICLNPREYVLDSPDGDVMLFDRAVDAVAYLRAHWEDMPDDLDKLDEYGVFIERFKQTTQEASNGITSTRKKPTG